MAITLRSVDIAISSALRERRKDADVSNHGASRLSVSFESLWGTAKEKDEGKGSEREREREASNDLQKQFVCGMKSCSRESILR